MKDEYVCEAEALWKKACQTNRHQQVYSEEYLRSNHWRSLQEERTKARGRRCEFCGSTRDLHLHHLHYREWSNVNVYGVMWLCAEHHEIVHQHIEKRKGGAPTFLAVDVIKVLAQVQVKETEAVSHQLAADLRSAQSQIARQVQDLARLQAPRAAEIVQIGIPRWMAGVLVAGALIVGIGIGVVVSGEDASGESPNRDAFY